MPTIYKYRYWCVTCQEWELFSAPLLDKEKKERACEVCGNPAPDGLKFGDVPDEKILEQRKRYAEYRGQRFRKTMNTYMRPYNQTSQFLDLFREDVPVEIIEHDAGQDKIDSDKRMNAERIRVENKEEVLKYKGLKRNDICRCGSGIKYKKCCLHRVGSLRY